MNGYIESALEALNQRGPLHRREQLACDFLSASVEIDSHLAPSFVMRISAVEVLAKQVDHSDHFLECAKQLARSIDIPSLTSAECEQLRNALLASRREGVMAAMRRVCLPLMGQDWMRDFTALYEVRSRIVHDGVTPTGNDHQKLRHLVEALLLKMLEGAIADS